MCRKYNCVPRKCVDFIDYLLTLRRTEKLNMNIVFDLFHIIAVIKIITNNYYVKKVKFNHSMERTYVYTNYTEIHSSYRKKLCVRSVIT